MQRFLALLFLTAFFLIANRRDGLAAPIELLADLDVRISGNGGVILCDQSLDNAVVNPAVFLSCSTGTAFPGAFIQAIANPTGSINIAAQFSVTDFTAISVGGSVTMKGDLIHVQHNTLTSGWLRIVGHPSGAITFSTLNCELGCSGAAIIDGDVSIGGIQHQLVGGSFVGGVPNLVTVFPEVLGAFLVPFTVGVQLPIEYSFEVSAGLIGGILPDGLSLLGQFSLSDPPIITILDINLQPVSDAQLISAAGVNYGASDTPSAPEPATLLLLGAAVVGVAARRHQGPGRGCSR